VPNSDDEKFAGEKRRRVRQRPTNGRIALAVPGALYKESWTRNPRARRLMMLWPRNKKRARIRSLLEGGWREFWRIRRAAGLAEKTQCGGEQKPTAVGGRWRG